MLPEVQIKNILDHLINEIDEKYLLKMFGETSLGQYNFYENSRSIFLKKAESSRHVETHIFFNHDRANLPTVHINLPSESMVGDNGIDWDHVTEEGVCEDGFFIKTPRAYSSKFNVIFTSSNTFEVLIMYYVVKSLIQGNIGLLELNELRNVKISGSDIIFNDGFMPQGIFSRALTLDCTYTFTGLSVKKIEPIRKVILEGEMKI